MLTISRDFKEYQKERASLEQRNSALKRNEIETSPFFNMSPIDIPTSQLEKYTIYTKNCVVYNMIKCELCPFINATQFNIDSAFKNALEFALKPDEESQPDELIDDVVAKPATQTIKSSSSSLLSFFTKK